MAENKEALTTVEETPVAAPAPAEPVKESKKEKKTKKRKYGEVMTTGAFVGTFILLLIPGINIICAIFWAIGAAKNRNKVNLSRGLIVFFFIEILLALILFGVGYIVADQKKDQVFKWANTKTNGVFEYMEIDEYKELPKLLGISKFLVEKEQPAEDNGEEPEVIIPKTSYICNPEGIESPEAFFELFEKQFSEDKEPVVNEDEETQVDKDEDKEPETLFEILEANNVDIGSERIYVIFDNDDANCVIVFNKDGLFEIDTYPTLTAGKDYIMVGGAN
ncbi:MAG: hypothetical protein MJ115_06145 [Clostridia bacterium]|nr:hypothetical protein [Clostridia bacterium]